MKLVVCEVAGYQDQSCGEHQPQRRFRHAVCTIAPDQNAGQGAHQYHTHQVPVDRARRPMSNSGHQRQRHCVRDIGADDARSWQLGVEQ